MKGVVPLVVGTVLAAAVAAQGPSPQERAAAVKESATQNQAALRQYTWVETTEIRRNDDVVKTEQKQCYYGADGKVQKTPIAGAKPEQAQQQDGRGGGRGDSRGGGRARDAIVENKVEGITEYMEKAAALVHEYVPPDPQKIQVAQDAGNISVAGGALTISNYVKPDDSLSIELDMASKRMLRYNVSSYVEKPKEDDVKLNITFGQLTDGTSYPQQIVLDVAAQNIRVTVTNSGHKKGGA